MPTRSFFALKLLAFATFAFLILSPLQVSPNGFLRADDSFANLLEDDELSQPIPQPKQATNSSVTNYTVTAPPASLKLNKFYSKYVSATGYPVVSSAKVNDYALKEAAYLIDLMLANRPDVRKAMIESGSRLIVMAHSEFTTDVPEYSQMKPKDFWDARARGLGGSRTDPVCSCGEENLLAFKGDPYHSENILIHEFAHNIHLRGMVRVDASFDRRLKKAYEQAMKQGLWKGKYASVNKNEYFAEGVQSWFDNNRQPDHDHNHVNTRKELQEYDPGLAALCEEVFGSTQLVYTKPTTRLHGHLAGYDPQKAPTFRWPERVKKAQREIRQKAQERNRKANQSGRLSTDQLSTDQHPVASSDLWLTFPGTKAKPGSGRQIVLIAAEQEYRSEQSMPMLAKILSQHHGFDCTVLFSVNEKGEVDPTLPAPWKDKSKRHNIPGLEHLAKADCLILLTRFMQLPPDQLQHFVDYFDSGKPLIALRTANHGFWGSLNYQKDGKPVSLRELLGGSFMGHHGGWHREATRGVIVDRNSSHPILTGVKGIFGPSDVYRCHNEKNPFPADCTALVLGQPLINLEPDAPANTRKKPLPIAWTKPWTGASGQTARIFHFTMGSARDFENEGVRRLTVNAVYWGLKMEKQIVANSSMAIVGKYKPLKSGFNYEKLGVKPRPPADYK